MQKLFKINLKEVKRKQLLAGISTIVQYINSPTSLITLVRFLTKLRDKYNYTDYIWSAKYYVTAYNFIVTVLFHITEIIYTSI